MLCGQTLPRSTFCLWVCHKSQSTADHVHVAQVVAPTTRYLGSSRQTATPSPSRWRAIQRKRVQERARLAATSSAPMMTRIRTAMVARRPETAHALAQMTSPRQQCGGRWTQAHAVALVRVARCCLRYLLAASTPVLPMSTCVIVLPVLNLCFPAHHAYRLSGVSASSSNWLVSELLHNCIRYLSCLQP